jgi:hypothetical protein
MLVERFLLQAQQHSDGATREDLHIRSIRRNYVDVYLEAPHSYFMTGRVHVACRSKEDSRSSKFVEHL